MLHGDGLFAYLKDMISIAGGGHWVKSTANFADQRYEQSSNNNNICNFNHPTLASVWGVEVSLFKC